MSSARDLPTLSSSLPSAGTTTWSSLCITTGATVHSRFSVSSPASTSPSAFLSYAPRSNHIRRPEGQSAPQVSPRAIVRDRSNLSSVWAKHTPLRHWNSRQARGTFGLIAFPILAEKVVAKLTIASNFFERTGKWCGAQFLLIVLAAADNDLPVKT
jgi:hypothetical protein